MSHAEEKPGAGITELAHGDRVDSPGQTDALKADVLHSNTLMAEAFAGEEAEHNEGLWSCLKKHPAATFWAMTMCFTIVSSGEVVLIARGKNTVADTLSSVYLHRSWSPSTCSSTEIGSLFRTSNRNSES